MSGAKSRRGIECVTALARADWCSEQTADILITYAGKKVLRLPASLIYERYYLRPENQPAFVRQASPFEDVVVRCVRYAFAKIPPSVGRVFFGKKVGLPWMRWRMLRHGYLRSPVHFREYRDVSSFS